MALPLQFGAVLPHHEIGTDPGAIAAYLRGLEELGVVNLLAYDHVLGADPEVHQPWNGPYNVNTTFHEPFVLFGFLAALVELEVTGIIILPQRQTALVAKQAVELDLLSRGRLRLGVGTGWNHVEYDALGVPFAERGARLDEQVELLRQLWSDPVIDYRGKFHRIDRAGLLPQPARRIPHGSTPGNC